MRKISKPILIVLAILAAAAFFLPQISVEADFNQMEEYIINKNTYTSNPNAKEDEFEEADIEPEEATEVTEADLALPPFKRELAFGEASLLGVFNSIDDVQDILYDGIEYRLQKVDNGKNAARNVIVVENFKSITENYVGFTNSFHYLAVACIAIGFLSSVCLIVFLCFKAKSKLWVMVALIGFIAMGIGGFAFNVAVAIARDGMSVASLQVGLPNLYKYIFFNLGNGYWYATYALGLIAFLYSFKAFRGEKPTV